MSSIGGVNSRNNTPPWRSVKCGSGTKCGVENVFSPGGSCRCRFQTIKPAAKGLLSIRMGDQPLTRIRAEQLFAAMNSRDVSELAPYMAEDATFDFPGAGCISGKKRILLFLKILFRKYPRLIFSVTDIIVEGERACAVWSNEGENAQGAPYRNRGITLVHIADGQITYISDYFKDTSFAESA